MNRTDAVVTLEISGIEGEDALDRVDAHDGDETGIIDPHALNPVVTNNPFPRAIDRENVRQQSQQLLDVADLP